MKKYSAARALLVSILSLVGVPAAYAGPTDNGSAGVDGLTASDRVFNIGVGPNGEGCDARTCCPSGYFCIFTGPYFTGTEYALYHCKNYPLRHWNGIGSYVNNNTGGSPAYLLDANGGRIVQEFGLGAAIPTLESTGYGVSDGAFNPYYDFVPVWYVRAC